jgi:hypothetical protein
MLTRRELFETSLKSVVALSDLNYYLQCNPGSLLK